jgi:hypothetical protein
MPYYGDYMTGDPGLFKKLFKGLKSIKLGSIIGHAVLPGLGLARAAAGGVGSGVVQRAEQVRAQTSAGVAEKVSGVKVRPVIVQRAARRGAIFTPRGKAVSPFAQRMARARAAAARNR